MEKVKKKKITFVFKSTLDIRRLENGTTFNTLQYILPSLSEYQLCVWIFYRWNDCLGYFPVRIDHKRKRYSLCFCVTKSFIDCETKTVDYRESQDQINIKNFIYIYIYV